MPHDSHYPIKSTIRLRGFAKANIAKIKERLSFYPMLKLIGEGSELEYLINNPDKESNRQYKINISKECLSLTLYSKTSPEKFELESMLVLLSIAQTLSDIFDFEINSIFPNLIHLLHSISKDDLRLKEEKIIKFSGRDLEAVLSKRIIELLNQNKNLNNELSRLNEKLAYFVGLAAFFEKFDGDSSKLSKKYDIDPSIAEKAIERKEEFASKGVYNANYI